MGGGGEWNLHTESGLAFGKTALARIACRTRRSRIAQPYVWVCPIVSQKQASSSTSKASKQQVAGPNPSNQSPAVQGPAPVHSILLSLPLPYSLRKHRRHP